MRCKYCDTVLEATLVPIGEGLQVSCACLACDATWILDIYCVEDMTQVEREVLWTQAEDPFAQLAQLTVD